MLNIPPRPRPFPRPTYLLVGNYGVGNAGDEILKEYFLKHFPEIEWQVLSANPKRGELSRFPGGIRSLLQFRWLRTLSALRKADGMVFGGGSLWTDAESLRACILWSIHAWFARVLRKPYFLAFQGIGPFRAKLGERLARSTVKHAAFISVRDEASFQKLAGVPFDSSREALETRSGHSSPSGEEWKKSTKVIQSFDPSFSLLEGGNVHLRTKNLFMFIPRFSTGWNAEMRRKFLALFRALQQKGAEIRLLSFHASDMRERELCSSFGEALQIPVESISSLQEASSYLRDATSVITERYHGALAAFASLVPFLAIRREEGDKLDAFAEMCGCTSETLESFTEDVVLRVDWERKAEELKTLQEGYRDLVRVGEEALRQALQERFLYTS